MTPLNITLVNPPFKYFPGVQGAGRSYTRPPLGIAYLASYLNKYVNHPIQINIIDCEAEGYSDHDSAIKAIVNCRPDVVGFSTVTGTCNGVSKIAKGLKDIDDRIVTIAGGPHITALPESYLPGVDINVFGEGEETLKEIVEKYVLTNAGCDINGSVIFKEGKIFKNSGTREFIEDIDTIPMPSRHMFKKGAYYHSYPYKGGNCFTTMFTSRGCPHSCDFCGNEMLWHRKVRYHSIERVCMEIDTIASEGYGMIFIDDDTFTTSKNRTMAICEHIGRNHPDLRWICHSRADTIDKDALIAMKKSGCVEMQIGVESGDQQILDNVNKNLDLGAVEKTFAAIRDVGINSWATFILGNDSEDEDSIEKSIKFARKINPTYCSFIILLPFPGSKIYERYKRKGFIKTDDWDRYSWHCAPIISLDTIDSDGLMKMRRRAYMEFYLRPTKLLEITANTLRAMSMREILRNVHAWYSIVKQ